MMKIDGRTRTIGLIGCPVEHTLSPVIHNYLSEFFSKNMVYLPFHVEETHVKEAVEGAFRLGIAGLNVTVPHKQHVMHYLSDIDDVAMKIGAVNTLVRTKDGYKGYNTDMEGLRRAVLSEGITLSGKTVVILGAGGASKAVVYMCLLEGAKKIYLLNRTFSKACEIAASFPDAEDRIFPMKLCDYEEITEQQLYVFQATSIGLAPNQDACVIQDDAFYEHVCVGFDLIYNPAVTDFMKRVTKAGAKAYNGLKMLLYQGLLAYSYWTGIPFSELDTVTPLVYERLYHQIHRQDNIVLIGFMGAGKSTVGRALAKRLAYDFCDTDALIEEQEGMSVSDIFAKKGEDYFRIRETETIRFLLENHHRTVFATGGGMPLKEENAKLLRLLGRTVFLYASPDETYNRLRHDRTRPLLNVDHPMEHITSLFEIRQPYYDAAAHMQVFVDNKSVEQIVDEIASRLHL